jgi:hypoxanthine phosphoribosyltransferase
MTHKYYIELDSLRADSYALGIKILDDDFVPDFMIALWRGGAPIGCYIHEIFKYLGRSVDHIAIRTSRYTGIDTVSDAVAVHNLGYLNERVTPQSKLLLVDDVFDSGKSIQAVLDTFKERFGDKCPVDIRIATVYYKPIRNKSGIYPHYFIHETNDWIVFPHELEDMSLEEIAKHRGNKVALAIQKFLNK